MSETVPSVSQKCMKNRNRCDTTVMRFSADKGKACFRPGSVLPHNAEKLAAQQDSENIFDASCY